MDRGNKKLQKERPTKLRVKSNRPQQNHQHQNTKIIRLYLDDYHQQQIPISQQNQVQQVLEVVSFDSKQQSHLQDLSVILKSFKEIQNREKMNQINRQISNQYLSFMKQDGDNYNASMIQAAKCIKIVQKLNKVQNQVKALRDNNNHHRQYLVDKFNLMKRQFVKMKQFIDNLLLQRVNKQQYTSQLQTQYRQLNKTSKAKNQQCIREIHHLKSNFQNEKNAHEKLKIQKSKEMQKNSQLYKANTKNQQIIKQLKQRLVQFQKQIKKKEKNQSVLFSRDKQCEKTKQSLQNQQKINSRHAQTQLQILKQSYETLVIKYNSITGSLKQKQQHFQNQIRQYDKTIKELKQKLQTSQYNQSRLQKQVRSRHGQLIEYNYTDKQKLSNEIKRLRGLLEVSEQQLIQCSAYIKKYSLQINQLYQERESLINQLKQNQVYFKNKLNILISSLNQCDQNVKNMTKNIAYKEEKLNSKQFQLEIKEKYLEKRSQDMLRKESLVQQMINQYQKQINNLVIRQEAMKAQYRMTMNIQKTNKDKWYEKYYSILSPQLHAQRDPIRTNNNNSPRHYRVQQKHYRVDQRRQKAQTISGKRRKLSRVKSEVYQKLHIPIQTNHKPLSKFQSQKSLLCLQNRINSLKHELKLQLGNIAPK